MGLATNFFDMFPRLRTWRKPDDTKGIEDQLIITRFLEQMSTQDNRMTAFPIYYVIRTAKWVVTDEDYASGYNVRILYINKEDHEDNITEEAFDSLPVDEESGVVDECGNVVSQENYERLCEKNVWQEEGLFLTETDAVRHLKLNSYHYSNNAHTYVKHAWRAPELEEFLLAVFHYFGVEPRKDKGTL